MARSKKEETVKGTASKSTKAANKSSRRKLLGSLGVLPVLGLFSAPASKKETEDKSDALTGPTFVTRSDKLEYARLKGLNLDDPEVVAKRKTMPVGKIGDLSVGRLISGSNLISMNMHARDLDYVAPWRPITTPRKESS